MLKSLIGDGFCDNGLNSSLEIDMNPLKSLDINLNCGYPWLKYDNGDCDSSQAISEEPIKEFNDICPPDFVKMTSTSLGGVLVKVRSNDSF